MKKIAKNVAIPVRVSTSKQEASRQVSELEAHSIQKGLQEAQRKDWKAWKATKLDSNDFLTKHKSVCRALRAGHSVRNAAKITGKGASTVQRVKAAMS